jgi:hypothetical protein
MLGTTFGRISCGNLWSDPINSLLEQIQCLRSANTCAPRINQGHRDIINNGQIINIGSVNDPGITDMDKSNGQPRGESRDSRRGLRSQVRCARLEMPKLHLKGATKPHRNQPLRYPAMTDQGKRQEDTDNSAETLIRRVFLRLERRAKHPAPWTICSQKIAVQVPGS